VSQVSFDVRPFAEHVPDSGPDPTHKNPESVEKGAGMIELGFYIGEHRLVLQSLKAGAFTDLFENGDPTTDKAAESASSSSSGAQQQPTASEAADATAARIAELEQRIAQLEQPPAAAGDQSDPQHG
jgi:uncharacterized membrane protein YccC